jgi:hypothetical protein
MMHDPPMLADFAVRLAFGLAALLLVTSWRTVPLAFFRTHCIVILGLLVLAELDGSRAGGVNLTLPIAGAVLAYLAAVSWGLGLPRAALPLTVLIGLATAVWLALASRTDPAGLWAFNAASRCASGLLLGATLTAMLLGHHYLTAPAMSIEPLKRYVALMGWALAGRAALALAGLLIAQSALGVGQSPATDAFSPLPIAMRWGMGFGGPLVATILAWKTAQIRSTQSATGILYVALALVLFGELTSIILAHSCGPII